MIMEFGITTCLTGKGVILLPVYKPLIIVVDMIFGVKSAVLKPRVTPKQIPQGFSAVKPFHSERRNFNIGIFRFKKMRKPSVRNNSASAIRKADTFIFVYENILLKTGDLVNLFPFKKVYFAVGIVAEHTCKQAEKGKAVIPIAIPFRTAAVIIKAAKVELY